MRWVACSYKWNRNVSSLFLNVASVMSGVRSSAGRLFHARASRSLDGEAAVAVVCSGAWNSQSAGVSGSKTPTGDCWRRLAMHLKVLWSHAVQTLVDQNCCLKRGRLVMLWAIVSRLWAILSPMASLSSFTGFLFASSDVFWYQC